MQVPYHPVGIEMRLIIAPETLQIIDPHIWCMINVRPQMSAVADGKLNDHHNSQLEPRNVGETLYVGK